MGLQGGCVVQLGWAKRKEVGGFEFKYGQKSKNII